MTIRLSTGLRDKLLGTVGTVKACLVGTSLALVDGGGSADSITDSGHRFLTKGFVPGDVLFLQSATTVANDAALTGAIVQTVTSATVTIPTGTVNTAETFAARAVLACAKGGSLKDVFKDGVLRFYSGVQPSSADSAPNGNLICEISVSSGTFTAGSYTNGLEFGSSSSGVISKSSTETWSGVGNSNAGSGGTVAQSWRLCANPTDAGTLSTTLARIDGSIGTSGSDINLVNTTIVEGATVTIDSFSLTLPYQYGA